MVNIRARLSAAMRDVVGWTTEAQSRRGSSRTGAVLMYHGVVEAPGDPAGSASPPLALTTFREGLRHLRGRYDVVPLAELRERISSRAKGQPLPVSLTFDDDLDSHRSLAAPLLSELELPATFFLTGSSLQGPQAFWWEDLEELFARGRETRLQVLREAGLGSDPHAIDAGIGLVSRTIQMMPPDRRDSLALRMRELVGQPPREPGLPAAAVRELADAGFEIGFHTSRHYHLQTLDDDALHAALREGIEELGAAAGHPPRSIAYPHAGADLRIAAASSAAGFKLGVVGNNRAVVPGQHPLMTERIDAWPCSMDGFAFRLSRIIAYG